MDSSLEELLGETKAALAPAAPARSPRRAVKVMVAASLCSAVCGVVQTFWIPRVLSVDAFGHWRMFLLYAGYAGLLHLGLADGALLTWAQGRSRTESPGRSRPSANSLGAALRFLASQHLLLLVPALALVWLRAPRPLGYLALALGAYALLYNVAGLVLVRLQAELRFSAVAFGLAAPGLLFVASFLVFALTGVALGGLLSAYLAAWAVTVSALLWMVRRQTAPAADIQIRRTERLIQRQGAWRTGIEYIAIGWPIVLANTGFGLMQSADRVTVNLTRPIHDFAIYSLSQSTIYVPVTILAALSRVALSFFARSQGTDRAAMYRATTRLLVLGWMLLLPYFYVVELVVRRFLPRYIAGLPAGRVLLLSVLFLSLIQIVQLNTFSLEGRQRAFFAGSVGAVAVAFATAWFGSRVIGSLAAVAWSQVITAMLWWLGNEWSLRARTPDLARTRWKDIAQVLAGFCVSALALGWIERLELSCGAACLLYAAAIIPAVLLLFPMERHLIAERVWS